MCSQITPARVVRPAIDQGMHGWCCWGTESQIDTDRACTLFFRVVLHFPQDKGHCRSINVGFFSHSLGFQLAHSAHLSGGAALRLLEQKCS